MHRRQLALCSQLAVQTDGRAESWPCRELAVQTRGRAGTAPEGHDHAASGCSCTTSQLRTPANRPLAHIRSRAFCSRTDQTRPGTPCPPRHNLPAPRTSLVQRSSPRLVHACSRTDHVRRSGPACRPQHDVPASSSTLGRRLVHPRTRGPGTTQRPWLSCQARPHDFRASCDGRASGSYTPAHAPTRYDAAAAPVVPARRSYLAPHSSGGSYRRARADHVRRSRRVRRATTRQHPAPVPRTTVDPAACTPALARRRRTTHSGRARRCPSSMASTAVGPSCRRMTFRPRATV